jgi:hypothetical protein
VSDDPTNPDEQPTNPDEPQATEDPEAGHDDIMKRLVDYQRQLRQGVEPTEAAAVAWHREPRDPVQSEPPSIPTEAPEQPNMPAEEPEVVDVSSPEPEETETEVEPAEQDQVQPHHQPPERVEILTEAEAQQSPAQPWQSAPASGGENTRTEISARIAQLESSLDRLSKLLGDLRENFQGMAVSADERLAAIEAEIERNRDRPDDPS